MGLNQDKTMLYNLDPHGPDRHRLYQFVDVLLGLISPRFSTERISGFYQLFINVSMKLLIAFSILIVFLSTSQNKALASRLYEQKAKGRPVFYRILQ